MDALNDKIGEVTSTGQYLSSEAVYETVKTYYGKVLASTQDLKTSACCAGGRPHSLIRQSLRKVPDEVLARFYGCGNPIPLGITGLNVLDLGSGSGRDCYVSASLVGPTGSVTGIDMTDTQLEVARKCIPEYAKNLGWQPNLKFVTGYIEFLAEAGIAPGSMDLVISNCVVNLSPDKERVIKGVYDTLKEGGEFHFSDVYCDRRLPTSVRKHPLLLGECIAGSLYVEDFRRICHKVGFADPRVLSKSEITIDDEGLKQVVGNARFYSITYRLFKLSNLESICEDYGQVAIYKGTIPGQEHSYTLDDHHVLQANKPFLVCGNTASMLGESWLKPHFTIMGNREVHYGKFPCGPTPAASAPAPAGGSCCAPGGGCC